MLVLPYTSKKNKSRALLEKLPEDFSTTIFSYSALFKEKGITPLLESSEENFENQFQSSTNYLYTYMISLGDLIIRKQKDYPNILQDLLSYNKFLLDELDEEFSNFTNGPEFEIISESLEVYGDYLNATMDPNIAPLFNTTEYMSAIYSMVCIMVCYSSFLVLIDKIAHKPRIFNMLLDKLILHKNNLESYLETAEIESDPDQMRIFKKTKDFE